jgi:hypothetical protein
MLSSLVFLLNIARPSPNIVWTARRINHRDHVVQAINGRYVTLEVRVRARVNPCGICDVQIVTGTGSSPSSSVLPCRYHSIVALDTNISPGYEQEARWWPQFGDVVSPHGHEQHPKAS